MWIWLVIAFCVDLPTHGVAWELARSGLDGACGGENLLREAVLKLVTRGGFVCGAVADVRAAGDAD